MYYLVFGPLYLFSLLPMRVLYLFSDCVYLFLYYVLGYRRKIVDSNLKIAFPNKTNAERKRIAKSFYRNFVDNFIETLKLLSASEDFIRKRFVCDWSVFDKIYEKGVRCQIHLGHNFNWEMGNLGMPLNIKYQYFLVVYMPIANKPLDRLFLYLRKRTGTYLLPATNMRRSMMSYRDKQYCLTLVADQVPGDVSKAYWLNFFGKPTPFVQGPEKGARAGNIPTVFIHFTKVKRGYYQAHPILAEENPGSLPEGELTRRYIRYLETTISANPDMWLWSHRRWKKEWTEGYKSLWIDTENPPAS